MARPFIGEYLEQFYEELEPLEFYREIFPEGQLDSGVYDEEKGRLRFSDQVAQYHGILIEKETDETHRRLNYVFNDLEPIRKAVEEKRDCVLAPVQYHGFRRTDENARRLNAFTFDWDGITEEKYLRNFFHQVKNGFIPEPTYLIFSGNGCHLYYLLTEPMRCKRADLDRMRKFKRAFTGRLWSPYLTEEHGKPQYEAVTQAMRLVGGATKDGDRVRAFRVGEPISVQELSSYTDVPIDPTEKKVIPLQVARRLWPDWYERRILEGEPLKDGYTCHRGLYDWWKGQIEAGATVGHRYFCIMVLAIFAQKSGVPFEELEEDAYDLRPYLSRLSSEPFTSDDIEAALRAYDPKNKNWSRAAIEKVTGITIPPNRRNGRKQADHLADARAIKADRKKRGALRAPEGRPSQKGAVLTWREEHPEGKKAECIRETGLSKSTVYRHWNAQKEGAAMFETFRELSEYLDTLSPEKVAEFFEENEELFRELLRKAEAEGTVRR